MGRWAVPFEEWCHTVITLYDGMKLPCESKNKECSRGKDGREEGREDPEQSSEGSVTTKGKEYNDVLANAQYRPCPCLPLL